MLPMQHAKLFKKGSTCKQIPVLKMQRGIYLFIQRFKFRLNVLLPCQHWWPGWKRLDGVRQC